VLRTPWLLVLGLLAGCRESKPAADTVPAAADVMRPAGGRTPESGARVVALTARDYAFDAPARLAAGVVTIRLRNEGLEPHQAWLVRLESDAAIEEFFDALRSGRALPPAGRVVGWPARADPGITSHTTVTLEPGSYLLVCPFSSEDGTSHVRKGMVRHLEVVPP